MTLPTNALAKLIAGTSGKKTRFHTTRGERLATNEFRHAARALLQRLSGRTDTGPWLAPPAVRYLDAIIEDDWVVAELGAGASTAWFAARASQVISLEHDPEWASIVADRLHSSAATNVQLVLAPLDAFDTTLARLTTHLMLDLLLVDQSDSGGGERVTSIALAKSKIREGGYVVLDDSDWAMNRPAFELLREWPHRRFIGVRPRPFQATETTIFRRPKPARPGPVGT